MGDGSGIVNAIAKKFWEYHDKIEMNMTNDGEFVALPGNPWGAGKYTSILEPTSRTQDFKIVKEMDVEIKMDRKDVKGDHFVKFGGWRFASEAVMEAKEVIGPIVKAILSEAMIDSEDWDDYSTPDGTEIGRFTKKKVKGGLMYLVDKKGDCLACACFLDPPEPSKEIDFGDGVKVEVEPPTIVLVLDDAKQTTADPFGDF